MPHTNGSAAPVVPLPDLADMVRSPIGTNGDGIPCLVGSRCTSCGAVYFPRRTICLECRSSAFREQVLSTRGVLYSWTTVRVSASRPTPYTVGYVDLPEGVRIFTTLLGGPGSLNCDQPVHLRIGPTHDWAYAPQRDPAVDARA